MRPTDETEMGGVRDAFLTTHWSLIGDIQAGPDEDQVLIGHLLERYVETRLLLSPPEGV